MSDFHGLSDEYDAPEGSKAAAIARRIAAENPATTDREKQYIAAISEIFNEDSIRSSQREDHKPDESGFSQPSRDGEVKYTLKMAKLHTWFPDDREAAIFYALALRAPRRAS